MIPRSDIEVLIEVDPASLRGVSTETVVQGVACIHGYEPGVFPGASWDAAAETLRAERDELAQLDATCADEAEFDEASYDAQGELCLSLEFGVTGAVEALCAAGCPTFASCCGHGEGSGGRSRHPWVLFAADADHLPLLIDAAKSSGCGLDQDDSGLLTMIAPSVVEAIDFGYALLSERDQFDAIPAMVDRDAVADLGEEEGLW